MHGNESRPMKNYYRQIPTDRRAHSEVSVPIMILLLRMIITFHIIITIKTFVVVVVVVAMNPWIMERVGEAV